MTDSEIEKKREEDLKTTAKEGGRPD